MRNTLRRVLAITVLAISLAAMPFQLIAQTNKVKPAKPTAENTHTNKPSAGPFHGKLAAVDKAGKTISVGKRTFQITSETRMNKSGKPATLEDAVVGEDVSGYVKPTDGGKLLATKVNFGPKVEAKSVKDGDKKKEK